MFLDSGDSCECQTLHSNCLWLTLQACTMTWCHSSRKHAYSNTLKILPPKDENFEIKNSDIFHISVQNIDCGYSLEPPQRPRFRAAVTLSSAGATWTYAEFLLWLEIQISYLTCFGYFTDRYADHSWVLGTYQWHGEVLLMSTHNVYFCGEIRKILKLFGWKNRTPIFR